MLPGPNSYATFATACGCLEESWVYLRLLACSRPGHRRHHRHFSLLYSVLLAPLPYAHANQLVMIWSHQKGDRIETSPNEYLDWQKQSTVFQSQNAWTGRGLTIATPDWTEQVLANRVAPGFFDLLSGEKAYLVSVAKAR